jgi:hypothetical protein
VDGEAADSTATILTKSAVQMVVDGPCLRGTLENLASGIGAKPMQEGALTKVRTAALGLLGDVLEAYATGVAAGEVGAGGSQRATRPPLH